MILSINILVNSKALAKIFCDMLSQKTKIIIFSPKTNLLNKAF